LCQSRASTLAVHVGRSAFGQACTLAEAGSVSVGERRERRCPGVCSLPLLGGLWSVMGSSQTDLSSQRLTERRQSNGHDVVAYHLHETGTIVPN
jgi:hypothetical protein